MSYPYNLIVLLRDPKDETAILSKSSSALHGRLSIPKPDPAAQGALDLGEVELKRFPVEPPK